MARDFMDTGEHFLLDLDELIVQVRARLTDQTPIPPWNTRVEPLLTGMLNSLFYGSVLHGERELEKKLKEYGFEEMEAIRSSRFFFKLLQNSLGMNSPVEMGDGLFDYQLLLEESCVVVHRAKMTPRPRRTPTSLEMMAHAIDESIQCGDYVPERLRRLVAERHH